MRKYVPFLLAAILLLAVAPAAFAQAAEKAPPAHAMWIAIAGSFGMAVAAAVCGLGQSRVAAAACEAIARNPAATDAIRAAMFLGLVFIETLVLFTLVIVWVKAA